MRQPGRRETRKAADAILDGIGKAIDAALDVLQSALLKALDLLEKVALLPLQAMEALAKSVQWMAKNGKFVLAALRLETDPDAVIGALKNALGGMITAVPEQAHAKMQQFAASLGAGAPVWRPRRRRQPPPAPREARRAPRWCSAHPRRRRNTMCRRRGIWPAFSDISTRA